MLRKFAALLCAASIALAVTGCAPSAPSATPGSERTEPPNNAAERFEQIATGGKPLENSNAKSLVFSKEGETTVATLTFAQGSVLNGTEESEPDSVPAYRAYCTSSPARFVLEFSSLDNWDYDRTFALAADDDLFYAVF